MAETKDIWAELRKPFDPKVVGKIPKGGIQLDYVGHAAVTDRLLSVDPEWHWEPLGLDDRGLPAIDAESNLWIKLTVNGVTRIGVGDGLSMKVRIGDALRNAAMRFGVALDLWTKDELESHLPVRPYNPDKSPEEPSRQITDLPITALSKDVLRQAIVSSKRFKSATEITGFYYDTIQKEAPTTESDVSKLIAALESK